MPNFETKNNIDQKKPINNLVNPEAKAFLKSNYWKDYQIYLSFVQAAGENWQDRMISLEPLTQDNLEYVALAIESLMKTNTYPEIKTSLIKKLNVFLAKKFQEYWMKFVYNEKNYPVLLKYLKSWNADYYQMSFEYQSSEDLKKKLSPKWEFLIKWLEMYDVSYQFDRQVYQKLFLAYLISKNVNENNFSNLLDYWKQLLDSDAFQNYFVPRFQKSDQGVFYEKNSWIWTKTYWNINALTTSETAQVLNQLQNINNIAFKDQNRSNAFNDYFQLFFQSSGKFAWLDIIKTLSDFCKNDFEKYFFVLNTLIQNKIKIWSLKNEELANILSQRIKNLDLNSIKNEIVWIQQSLTKFNFEIFWARKTFYLTWDDKQQFPISQKWKSMLKNTSFYSDKEVDYLKLQQIFQFSWPMNLVVRAHWASRYIHFWDWVDLSCDELAMLYIERKKMWIKNDILITTACFWRNFTKNFIESWKKIDPSLTGMPIVLSETENFQVAYLSNQPIMQNSWYNKSEFWSIFIDHILKTNNVSKLVQQEWNKKYKTDSLNINFSYFLPTKNWLEQVAETKNIDNPVQA